MDFIATWWPYVLAGLGGLERVIAVVASVHAILKKRETRATIAWVGLIWLTPLVGSIAYAWLGINRLQLRRGEAAGSIAGHVPTCPSLLTAEVQERADCCQQDFVEFSQLVDLVGGLTGRPLLPGNQIEPLVGGAEAFPAMLTAIEGAERSIALESYIFDNDRVGAQFVEALAAAQQRGVEVRVLVDDVGARYSRPTVISALRQRELPCATFLPTLLPHRIRYSNLRNHRKILIIDGEFCFTGGMNIRESCRLDWNPPNPVNDLHFRVAGPVAQQLQETFVADWLFTTEELLRGDLWFPQLGIRGNVVARGIPDGPDENFDKLRMSIIGAIGMARQRVIVVTPYFLPDDAMVAALNVAALRGVNVQIVLPSRNNIRLVHWAVLALLPQVLERGCHVYLSPPPFDHSKLFLVDDTWSLVGSTNWDPRSLRLNFEFNVECYSRELTGQLIELANQKIAGARKITLEEIANRNLVWRLRDGIARLATPYL